MLADAHTQTNIHTLRQTFAYATNIHLYTEHVRKQTPNNISDCDIHRFSPVYALPARDALQTQRTHTHTQTLPKKTHHD